MKKIILLILTIVFINPSYAIRANEKLKIGAENFGEYEPLLRNKKVACVVNQTSEVNNTHLVDFLIENGINVVKIFGPEHGFRGTGDAGEKMKNEIDATTNLPVISLYGSHKKPTKEDLQDVDIVIYDIQDVGARFYTYISTLQYVMEACAENKKQCIVFDRPNPNGHYVAGPVLELKNKSFVGMQAIPIVHGMTIGEYAKMLNGEKWLDKKVICNLKVIAMTGYTHNTNYTLKIPPSPNLKTQTAIYLYPSLCLFEGTEVSVGRGTDNPFEIWGHPSYTNQNYQFTPTANFGSKDPLYKNKICKGKNLKIGPAQAKILSTNKILIQEIIDAYAASPNKDKFFNKFFTNLAGNTTLQKQIIAGESAKKIEESWKANLDKFKKIRKKYLLYPDFN